MKAGIFKGPGKMVIRDIAKPKLEKTGDAIIRVLRACVCGSDLWWFRGISKRPSGSTSGHEAIGIVDQVGTKVHNIKVGDFVIVPFTHGDGTCRICRAGFDGNCPNGPQGGTGYQAEYVRYPNANWGLVKIPGQPADYSDAQLNDLLTLADVMATGYHAAWSSEIKKGDTVAVIGDGAVGLCAVISAKLLGAVKIILLSHHADRAKLGREFGATDVVSSRGKEAIKDVLALTENKLGADEVLECVGATSAIEEAGRIARPGAIIGRVGVPQIEPKSNQLFWQNIGLRGGVAAVTTHDKKKLLNAILEGKIHPGKVFTERFDLDHLQEAFEAMDQRKAIKSLVIVAKQ